MLSCAVLAGLMGPGTFNVARLDRNEGVEAHLAKLSYFSALLSFFPLIL